MFCFQSRSQGLLKNLHDTYEQIEQTAVELNTFENLRQHEIGAIPKRLEVRVCHYVHYPHCTTLTQTLPAPSPLVMRPPVR